MQRSEKAKDHVEKSIEEEAFMPEAQHNVGEQSASTHAPDRGRGGDAVIGDDDEFWSAPRADTETRAEMVEAWELENMPGLSTDIRANIDPRQPAQIHTRDGPSSSSPN